MCSRIIHFFVLKELTDVEKRCIKSVYSHNKNYSIIYHTCLESLIPEELIFPKSHKNINDNINEYILTYYKLIVAHYYGGIILNNDTICLQTFDIIINTFNNTDKNLVLFKNDNNYKEKNNFLKDIIISKPKNSILKNLIDNKNNITNVIPVITEEISKECIILPYQIFIELKTNDIINVNQKDLKILLKHSLCIKLYDTNTDSNILENLFNISENPFYETIFDDKIYYINLKSRPERNIYFISTWSRIFKNIYRFDACVHSKVGNVFINGCAKSHYQISESILKNEDYVIVLEDDAYPTDDFMEFFPKVMEYVKNNTNNFEWLNFGSPTIMEQKIRLFNPKIINENILQVDSLWSAHFNIYTKGILHYFYKYFTQNLLKTTIHNDQDSYFRDDVNLRKMITYPLLSLQDIIFYSDTINMYRSGDYYSVCSKQIEFAIEKRREGIEGNLFEITPKEIHHR